MALEPLSEHCGIIIPIERRNVDTDAILPKQYLKKLEGEGYGDYLFDDERYLDPGDLDVPISQRRPDSQCILNQTPFDQGTVLLARDNFGCGSSREHAVWALRDFGIRVLIAPSYGDIFRSNCFNNGLLPIIQPDSVVERLFELVLSDPGLMLEVDVAAGAIQCAGEYWSFELDDGRAQALIKGLDEIGLTLERAASIKAYEGRRRKLEPWLFGQKI
jgi:3-isopropylmalate/(R)-2-methylmalate dehydratase small subunit